MKYIPWIDLFKIHYALIDRVSFFRLPFNHKAILMLRARLFRQSDFYHVAAAYLFYITRTEPFFGGNLWTGWAAMNRFLELNGYQIQSDLQEIQIMLKRTRLDFKFTLDDLADWIQSRAVAQMRPKA